MRLLSNLIALFLTALPGSMADAEEPTKTAPEVSVAPRVHVIPVVFDGKGEQGDYAWMRDRVGYEHTYFVFNDNEVQFLAHQEFPTGIEGCEAGGGNAAARPWQCETPPRSGGVPTGSGADDGYQAL